MSRCLAAVALLCLFDTCLQPASAQGMPGFGGGGAVERSVIFDFMEMPVTCIVIAACCAVCYHLNSKSVGYAEMGLNYDKIVVNGELWRVVTSTFSHVSLLHLGFNCAALWQCRSMEVQLGHFTYVVYTVVLMVVGCALYLAAMHCVGFHMNRPQMLNSFAIGYSGVVFGWMTIQALTRPSGSISIAPNMRLPLSFAPFSSMLITQLMVPQASFLGHLMGILAGYLVGWGCFKWLCKPLPFAAVSLVLAAVIMKSVPDEALAAVAGVCPAGTGQYVARVKEGAIALVARAQQAVRWLRNGGYQLVPTTDHVDSDEEEMTGGRMVMRDGRLVRETDLTV